MWKIFSTEIRERYSEEAAKHEEAFLNSIEEQGYEPRAIEQWERNSVADSRGITVYARKRSAIWP